MVGNRYLMDLIAFIGYLGGYLGLKAEPILFDFYAIQNFPSEDLIARLHIGEGLSDKNIGEKC